MDIASTLALAFAIGVVAGLRSMTAPAVVSWAARLGWLHLQQTGLAFLAYPATLTIVTLLAAAELVGDKLPMTPSRKSPGPFAGRILLGAFSGAALCLAAKHPVVLGALLG